MLTIPFQVVARFRPPNRAEMANGGESIVNFESEDTCSINVRNPSTIPAFVLEGGKAHAHWGFEGDAADGRI